MAAHGVLAPVGAYKLGEKLPEIQALHKRVVLQLMPLLLQVGRRARGRRFRCPQQQVELAVCRRATCVAPTCVLPALLPPPLQVQQERLDMQEAVHAAADNDGRQQAANEQLLAQTPAMEELTRVMLQYSRDIHTFAIANRVSTYSLYTLNIETGVMGQPPPEGHWARVAGMLKDRCVGSGVSQSDGTVHRVGVASAARFHLLYARCHHHGPHSHLRLSPQALADLCVARQLYSCTVTKVKQQRQLLILRLAQLLSRWAARGYRTDAVFNDVAGACIYSLSVLQCAVPSCLRCTCLSCGEASHDLARVHVCGWCVLLRRSGPHCEGMLLLDAIDSNMRKEYTTEGVYQVCCVCWGVCCGVLMWAAPRPKRA
jgi:hypothetical protein